MMVHFGTFGGVAQPDECMIASYGHGMAICAAVLVQLATRQAVHVC